MILGAVKKLYDVSPQNRIVPRASIFPKDNEYENLTVINFTNIYFTQIQNLPARRKRHIACDEIFMLRIKISSRAHSAAPRSRTGFASLDSGSDKRRKYGG